LAERSLQKLSPQSKVNLRADKITAVPFVPDTFFAFTEALFFEFPRGLVAEMVSSSSSAICQCFSALEPSAASLSAPKVG
jgi:hypothetical protein